MCVVPGVQALRLWYDTASAEASLVPMVGARLGKGGLCVVGEAMWRRQNFTGFPKCPRTSAGGEARTGGWTWEQAGDSLPRDEQAAGRRTQRGGQVAQGGRALHARGASEPGRGQGAGLVQGWADQLCWARQEEAQADGDTWPGRRGRRLGPAGTRTALQGLPGPGRGLEEGGCSEEDLRSVGSGQGRARPGGSCLFLLGTVLPRAAVEPRPGPPVLSPAAEPPSGRARRDSRRAHGAVGCRWHNAEPGPPRLLPTLRGWEMP